MANIIKYELCTSVKDGTQWKEIFNQVTMPWNEQNERIAMSEAHNGAYTIEESEAEYPSVNDIQDDIDAMLVDHEYRLTLLESEV